MTTENKDKHKRMNAFRHLKDKLATVFVGIGGLSVIVSLLLIFFYLFYVVIPLFGTPDSESEAISISPESTLIDVLTDEYGENSTFVQKNGVIQAVNNKIGQDSKITLESFATPISAYSSTLPNKQLLAFGFQDGSATVAEPGYKITYPNDKRFVQPTIAYPFGREPIQVSVDQNPISHITVQRDSESATLFALDDSNQLIMVKFEGEESFLTDEIEWTYEVEVVGSVDFDVFTIFVNDAGQHLSVVGRKGELVRYDIADLDNLLVVEQLDVVDDTKELTAFAVLSGGASYLIGTSDGQVSQWFSVRDENNVQQFTKIRVLREADDTPIELIVAEPNRKVLFVKPQNKDIEVYHSTAERLVMTFEGTENVDRFTVSIRGDKAIMIDGDSKVRLWSVHNEHPEISMKALWGKVWYEGYSEPDYIWQSSAADSDFESKYSLMPISFGTLKAAFYAMLFAVPLAILGAIYTAYFMAPALRQFVKPAIEIMEALPTVILGFLAGLWLAPFLEVHLPGFFVMLVSLPVAIILCAFTWFKVLPKSVRAYVPDGWHAALLIVPICLVMFASVSLSQYLELTFFDGNIREWLTGTLGLGFDQRNALVVGIAMGFAVIPTVFSITEDAIFSVPKQLTLGSLALGATPWQSLSRVVLLTASPGIFSAVMVGLGRAVGETMIVLMATGNTPVMDLSIFEGMRTLSANIAVEMPESEVGSTHYRVLFLAALVLFVFTFVFNTGAEVVRQRLRKKYSSL